MYINVTNSRTAKNKGSSGQLVHYLSKEDRMHETKTLEAWFNGMNEMIPSYDVKFKIDENIAKLTKGDSKFFLINVSPSQKEITFLKNMFGEEGAKSKLKQYAVAVMDHYAQNFNRPGIVNNENLLWFGKLENHRYFTYMDKEVKTGEKKRGELKPGEHMHIQIIVSRKDISNKVKLSPDNTSRGKNKEHSKKMGQFDRKAFKNSGELIFDQIFQYQRGITETFNYANIQKNGSWEQKQEVMIFLVTGSHYKVQDNSYCVSSNYYCMGVVPYRGRVSAYTVQNRS